MPKTRLPELALLTAALLSTPATASAAGPVPLAAKVRASLCATCSQSKPTVAGLANGEFFVAWEGKSTTDPQGVAGRVFRPNGTPKTRDLQINQTNVLPVQNDAAVAGDAMGYVAAWAQVDGINSEIYFLRYSTAGVVQGTATKVSVDNPQLPPYLDFNPVVVKTTGGSFVVVWVRFLPAGPTTAGSNPEVFLRRFDKNGVALGAPVKLNQRLVNGDRPDVCVDSTGQIDVAWTSADGFPPFEANHKGVSVRRVSPAGVPLGAEIVVAPPTASAAPVGISCGPQGKFVVVWQSDQRPNVSREDILGARYDKAGRRQGAVFVVNSGTAGSQRNPQISFDTAGNFVVVWQSDNPPSGGGVFGRRFSVSGVATGTDFTVDTFTGTEPKSIDPDVAHLGASKNFVVAFQDGLKGIWTRRFGPGAIRTTAPEEDEAALAGDATEAEEPVDE